MTRLAQALENISEAIEKIKAMNCSECGSCTDSCKYNVLIDRATAKMIEYQTLAELSPITVCPTCGAYIPGVPSFCSSCGQRLKYKE